MKKLKFFLIGLVPGLIIVFFVLNKKGVSCSGYLPNSRVIAETLSKDFEYSDQFTSEMNALKIDEKFLKDSIITNGKIDFDRSNAQKKPCPDYLLSYPEKKPSFEITFEKCEEKAVLLSLKKL
ncbi:MULTISPECIES: hypothetical protein [Chryseobacterium]|uniref:DUF4258 domain-containing protein n=1 Tax=Chryseobacterium taihuense TaxID=1141221 RepID=A0A1G9S845_9FLAO|nr:MULTISPECIES: hypothetical protein [Chryseobacterium]QQV01877.1 hypothetical protein I6I61_12395 [Chryseobacterium sp. FDAARGOS 1104]SDM30945.1 hypothetical protein SAMN05216273_12145 [Chryseobacterium taihuense]VFB04902.1 Uncharacterised protein [Chryseobacterium taihuense]